MDAGLTARVEEVDRLAGAAGFAAGSKLLRGVGSRGKNTVGIELAAEGLAKTGLGDEELVEGKTAVLE